MRFLCAVILVSVVCVCLTHLSEGVPVDGSLRNESNAKSAFGQPFDEVVVESTLNVKRKANPNRQSRSADVTRTQEQYHRPSTHFQNTAPFGGSSALATEQAQSHETKSPFGSFGASASGSQSQSLLFGPNGPIFSGSFAGTQQYQLPNGQTLDVSFGNAVGAFEASKPGGATTQIH